MCHDAAVVWPAVVATRSTTSGAAEVLIGVLLVVIGAGLLWFRDRLRSHAERVTRGDRPALVALSVYGVPATFVVVGLVAVIAGAKG